MNRAELEHLIRAAGTIANDDLVIVGSQAVLGALPDAPSELLRSMEADMYPRHNPEAADEIDGRFGGRWTFGGRRRRYGGGLETDDLRVWSQSGSNR